MDIAILFPLLLIVGVMFLMSRNAKSQQRRLLQLHESLEPGAGVRTVGGMYAQVKEVREDTVLLEITPGVHAVFAKNAIGAVLETEEYERIISGESPSDDDETLAVPDDASALTGDAPADRPVELGKPAADGDADPDEAAPRQDRDGRDGDGEGRSSS